MQLMNNAADSTPMPKLDTHPLLDSTKLLAMAANINNAGTLTAIERHELMAAIMDDALSTEERVLINCLIYAYRRARFKA